MKFRMTIFSSNISSIWFEKMFQYVMS